MSELICQLSSRCVEELEEGELPPSPIADLVKSHNHRRRKNKRRHKKAKMSHDVSVRKQVAYDDLPVWDVPKVRPKVVDKKNRRKRSALSRLGEKVQDTKSEMNFAGTDQNESRNRVKFGKCSVLRMSNNNVSLRARLGLKQKELTEVSTGEKLEEEYDMLTKNILLKRRCRAIVAKFFSKDTIQIPCSDASFALHKNARKITDIGNDNIVIMVGGSKASTKANKRTDEVLLTKRILNILESRPAIFLKRKNIEEVEHCNFNTLQLKRLKLACSELQTKLCSKNPRESTKISTPSIANSSATPSHLPTTDRNMVDDSPLSTEFSNRPQLPAVKDIASVNLVNVEVKSVGKVVTNNMTDPPLLQAASLDDLVTDDTDPKIIKNKDETPMQAFSNCDNSTPVTPENGSAKGVKSNDKISENRNETQIQTFCNYNNNTTAAVNPETDASKEVKLSTQVAETKEDSQKYTSCILNDTISPNDVMETDALSDNKQEPQESAPCIINPRFAPELPEPVPIVLGTIEKETQNKVLENGGYDVASHKKASCTSDGTTCALVSDVLKPMPPSNAKPQEEIVVIKGNFQNNPSCVTNIAAHNKLTCDIVPTESDISEIVGIREEEQKESTVIAEKHSSQSCLPSVNLNDESSDSFCISPIQSEDKNNACLSGKCEMIGVNWKDREYDVDGSLAVSHCSDQSPNEINSEFGKNDKDKDLSQLQISQVQSNIESATCLMNNNSKAATNNYLSGVDMSSCVQNTFSGTNVELLESCADIDTDEEGRLIVDLNTPPQSPLPVIRPCYVVLKRISPTMIPRVRLERLSPSMVDKLTKRTSNCASSRETCSLTPPAKTPTISPTCHPRDVAPKMTSLQKSAVKIPTKPSSNSVHSANHNIIRPDTLKQSYSSTPLVLPEVSSNDEKTIFLSKYKIPKKKKVPLTSQDKEIPLHSVSVSTNHVSPSLSSQPTTSNPPLTSTTKSSQASSETALAVTPSNTSVGMKPGLATTPSVSGQPLIAGPHKDKPLSQHPHSTEEPSMTTAVKPLKSVPFTVTITHAGPSRQVSQSSLSSAAIKTSDHTAPKCKATAVAHPSASATTVAAQQTKVSHENSLHSQGSSGVVTKSANSSSLQSAVVQASTSKNAKANSLLAKPIPDNVTPQAAPSNTTAALPKVSQSKDGLIPISRTCLQKGVGPPGTGTHVSAVASTSSSTQPLQASSSNTDQAAVKPSCSTFLKPEPKSNTLWGAPSESYEFVSTDPAENADNFDKRWANMRNVSSEVELYRIIRERWHNLSIPNPSRNLTCRRKKTSIKVPRLRTSAQPTRARTQSCTDVYERKICSLRLQNNKALENLDRRQHSEMQSLMARQKHAMDRMGFTDDYMPTYWGNPHQDIEIQQQQKEVEQLRRAHQQQQERLCRTRDAEISKYQAFQEEIHTFYNFYQKLDPNSRHDRTILTEEQIQLAEETERMFRVFKTVYDRN